MTLLYNVDQLYGANGTSNYNAGSSNQANGNGNFTNSVFTKEEGSVISTGTKSIVKQALKLIFKLVSNESASATKEGASLNADAASTAAEQAKNLSEIEGLVNKTTAFIDDNNKIIQGALDKINGEVQPELERNKQEIENRIAQIEQLKTTILGKPANEQLAILAQIGALADEIIDFINNCTALQGLISEQLELVNQTHSTMVASAEEADASVAEMTAEITEVSTETAAGTAEATAQGVEGGVNEVNAGVLGTASAALAGTSVVTMGATAAKAADCAVKAADQGVAGGIRFGTAAAAGAQFLSIIGSLTNNTSALGAFSSFLGNAYGTFANAVGIFNNTVSPMINSIGSMADNAGTQGQVAMLQAAIATDEGIINSAQTNNENDDKLQTPKFTFGV